MAAKKELKHIWTTEQGKTKRWGKIRKTEDKVLYVTT
jgi:hypothetical protein